MNLDLVNDLVNHVKENPLVRNLIDELSHYLETNSKGKLGLERQVPRMEQILSEHKLTTGNENAIRQRQNDILLAYAEKNYQHQPMYLIQDNKKIEWHNNQRHENKDAYTVLQIQDGKMEQIAMDKDKMPEGLNVNDVFRMEDGKILRDDLATKELQEEITDMVKQILDNQERSLSKYRKEGHLYMVTQEVGNNRFLCDLEEEPRVEFEEVAITEDLLHKATEGIVLKYENGRYEYYADDGYERI